MFYTPNNNFRVEDACSKPQLRLITPGTDITGSQTPVLLDYGKAPDSIGEILEKVQSEEICTSTRREGDSLATYFWWNEEKLIGQLEQIKQQVVCGLPVCGPLQVSC